MAHVGSVSESSRCAGRGAVRRSRFGTGVRSHRATDRAAAGSTAIVVVERSRRLEDRDDQTLFDGAGAGEAREAAMTTALLFVAVVGMVTLALLVDVAAVVGWLRRIRGR